MHLAQFAVKSEGLDRSEYDRSAGILSFLRLKVIPVAALFVLTLIVLVVFVPFSPTMPTSGIDNSWQFGLNQAVAQGLVLGKDIVFTFGPYACVYTRFYHPGTDHLAVGAGLLLGLCYSLLLILLAPRVRPVWLLLFGLCLLLISVPRDHLFLSYPLLLAVAIHRLALAVHRGLNHSTSRKVLFAFLFMPLGLLPIIKSSYLPLCVIVSLTCMLLFWLSNNRILACLAVLVPVSSAMVLWVIAGQPILRIFTYVMNMAPIFSGYSDAMSVTPHGMNGEILGYILASVVIVWNAWKGPGNWTIRTLLAVSYAAFLFLMLKGGFVRHDGHVLMAAMAVLLAAFSLKFLPERRWTGNTALVLAFIVWAYIDSHRWPTSTASFINQVSNQYEVACNGMRSRIAPGNVLKAKFDDALKAIRAECPIARLEGTVDIYSYEQSCLIASGNIWSPRPVFQSYSAYTPALLRMNDDHLRGGDSPRNILFRVEPLDGRLPALEDGRSWVTLIDHYHVTRFDRGLIYFEKRQVVLPEVSHKIFRGTPIIGQELMLPSTDKPTLAELDIAPTFLGRVFTTLFKPPKLMMSVTLANGEKKDFRIISGMAKSRFILSPLVENTDEFRCLASSDGCDLRDKRVKSIKVVVPHNRWLWKQSYQVSLDTTDLHGNPL